MVISGFFDPYHKPAKIRLSFATLQLHKMNQKFLIVYLTLTWVDMATHLLKGTVAKMKNLMT